MAPDSTIFDYLTYDQSTGIFRWVKARQAGMPDGSVAGTTSGNGYTVIIFKGRQYRAQNLAWFFVTGEWPVGIVDHKNLAKSDNRFNNLRLATAEQNLGNQRRRSAPLKGAYLDKRAGKWSSQIRINGRIKRLGTFNTAEEAHAAYRAAALSVYGEFARFD